MQHVRLSPGTNSVRFVATHASVDLSQDPEYPLSRKSLPLPLRRALADPLVRSLSVRLPGGAKVRVQRREGGRWAPEKLRNLIRVLQPFFRRPSP